MSCAVFVVFAALLVSTCNATSKQDLITAKAKAKIGSEKWTYDHHYSFRFGSQKNKCNLFVADVLKEAGANAPERNWYTYSPIEAAEWANPQSSALTSATCWSSCSTSAKAGDVIAVHGHVGIVTGYHLTTSASALANPKGKVVENDWGFRSGERKPTCWRYTCS